MRTFHRALSLGCGSVVMMRSIADTLGEDRSDDALARVAIAEQRIIVTKDSDFDPPRQNERVLRLQIGNCSNARLLEWLATRLDDALARFARNEIYVEAV